MRPGTSARAVSAGSGITTTRIRPARLVTRLCWRATLQGFHSPAGFTGQHIPTIILILGNAQHCNDGNKGGNIPNARGDGGLDGLILGEGLSGT
jgi:hypothetical protein